jgi:hypothetical protein
MLDCTERGGDWNPPRRSVWEDPEVIGTSLKWANYRGVVEAGRRDARLAHSRVPFLLATHTAWWCWVRRAILSEVSVAEALDRAAQEMACIVEEHCR